MRAVKWRVRLLGPVNQWHKIRQRVKSLTIVSAYDSQIRIDIARTHSTDAWFDPHRERLCQLLNVFAATNVGFGYPQGLNYLVFPLWQVYYTTTPEWAVEDTLYSLQRLVGVLLPVYPVDRLDSAAAEYLSLICSNVKFQATQWQPALRQRLFSDEYAPFVMSLVSSMVPTMFSNIFSVDDTLLLWDVILQSNCLLTALVSCVSTLICLNRNAVLHLPLYKCMEIMKFSAPHSLHRLTVWQPKWQPKWQLKNVNV